MTKSPSHKVHCALLEKFEKSIFCIMWDRIRTLLSFFQRNSLYYLGFCTCFSLHRLVPLSLQWLDRIQWKFHTRGKMPSRFQIWCQNRWLKPPSQTTVKQLMGSIHNYTLYLLIKGLILLTLDVFILASVKFHTVLFTRWISYFYFSYLGFPSL